MYEFLKHTHSIIRYVVLLGGIGSILVIAMNVRSKAKMFSTIFLSSTHLQVVIGLVLYFGFSPWFKQLQQMGGEAMKNSTIRFFAIEHISMMLIAAVLITIGNSKLKKALANNGKLRPTLVLYIIALVVIFAAIPWPFREALGKGWY